MWDGDAQAETTERKIKTSSEPTVWDGDKENSNLTYFNGLSVPSPPCGMATLRLLLPCLFLRSGSEPTVWDGDEDTFSLWCELPSVPSPPCGMATVDHVVIEVKG